MPIAARSKPPIDIAICDKSPLIVRGLRELLTERGFNVVASAQDGERLLDALPRLTLDVVISGWIMPYCDGATLLQRMAERRNPPRVIIYSGDLNPQVPRLAMRLGAAAFLAKSDAPETLVGMVRAVADGAMVFPFSAARPAEAAADHLTSREAEMLGMLATGLTNQEMADRLTVSLNTIKFHLRNLYDKLGVRNRAEAVAMRATPLSLSRAGV